MKFGKLDDISGIDFSLPADHPENLSVLRTGNGRQLEVFSGGTMWGIPKWKGKIFPEKTPVKDFASHYCQQFGCIELNATHYRIHPPATIEKWKALAPQDFRFCPKWPQLITHYRRFNNSDGLTDEFLEAVMHFGENLGPCFLQLPPNYTQKYAARLREYLKTLPRDIKIAVEYRHPDWFTGSEEVEKTWTLMQELGIGAVVSDTSGRRDAVHMRLTAPWMVMRYGGNNLDSTDRDRLEDWALRIKSWAENGLEAFYLLVHQENSILTPETCVMFNELLSEHCGIETKTPQFYSNQGALL